MQGSTGVGWRCSSESWNGDTVTGAKHIGEEKVTGSIHGGEEFTKIDSWEILFVAMDIACKQFDTLLTWILYLASGGKTTETIERGSYTLI
jgi:hypothetical protein